MQVDAWALAAVETLRFSCFPVLPSGRRSNKGAKPEIERPGLRHAPLGVPFDTKSFCNCSFAIAHAFDKSAGLPAASELPRHGTK